MAAPAPAKTTAGNPAAAGALIKGVTDALAPNFTALMTLAQKNTVSLGAVQARLESLEQMINTKGGADSSTAPRRAVRTGGATATKKKTAEAKEGGAPVFANALIYFKFLVENDIENARELYAPKESLELPVVSGEKSVIKHKATYDKNPDSAEFAAAYYKAAAIVIWSKVFSKEDKEAVTALFKNFKENQERADAEPPLEADGEEAAAEEPVEEEAAEADEEEAVDV